MAPNFNLHSPLNLDTCGKREILRRLLRVHSHQVLPLRQHTMHHRPEAAETDNRIIGQKNKGRQLSGRLKPAIYRHSSVGH